MRCMSLKILFIDDEQRILEGLQRSVRPFRKEWDASFANSGQEGLRLLDEAPFDVVVTDMRMPEMDGVAVLNVVMHRHPQLFRIILSGYSDMESIIKSAGVAHQYLCKPCPIEEIRSAIARACSLSDLFCNAELKRLLSGTNTIPSLPLLFVELTRLINDPTASMNQIAELISRDIGMSAKVLQLVNSAFFGKRRVISDPREAVQYLGLGTLRALSLAVHVFTSFESRNISPAFASNLWRHSLECSAVAQGIAKMGRPADTALQEHAAMAGLLHDVGSLLLVANMAEGYQRAVALAERSEIPMWKAEREIFCASHAECGAYILAFWGLPQAIVEAIAYHHAPSSCSMQSFSALTAVHLAECLLQEPSPTDPSSASRDLDLPYLESLGLAGRTNEFRDLVMAVRSELL
jgi:putative nucleotidyltransferase with HDIG domain